MHNSESKPGSLLKARGWDGALPSTEVYWEKAIISSHLETTVSQGILGWGKQAVDITSWAGNEPATCCLTLYWGHGGGLNGSNCKSPKLLDKQDEGNTHTVTLTFRMRLPEQPKQENTEEESPQSHQDRSGKHEMPRDKMNLMKLSYKDFKISMPRMFKDISKGIMSINNKKFWKRKEICMKQNQVYTLELKKNKLVTKIRTYRLDPKSSKLRMSCEMDTQNWVLSDNEIIFNIVTC